MTFENIASVASTSAFATGVDLISGSHGSTPARLLDFDEFDCEPVFADLVESMMGAEMLDHTNRFFENGRGSGFRRVHGRFGGDTGNRKRRVYERFDNDIEHRIRLRNEKRAAEFAIIDGVEEYRLSRVLGKTRSSRHESRADEKLPDNMVRASRTGHIVEVIRVKRRSITKSAIAGVVSRPTVSVDHVRATLRLPSRG
jgi:hypothetical protein